MTMEVNCPECHALLQLAEEHAGRQARCPSCSAVFTAQRPSPAVESARVSSDPINPYAPTYTEPSPRVSADWAPREISPEEVFSKAWVIFKDQWVMTCSVVLIVGAINIGLNMVQNGVVQVLNAAAVERLVINATQVVMGIGGWVIQIWLQLGQTMVMLDIARGRKIELSKVFSGGPYLVKALIAAVLVSLIIGAIGLVLVGIPAAVAALIMQDVGPVVLTAFIGFAIAIVPIAIVSLMFSQIHILIIDRGVRAVDSLRTSREITNGNKLTIFVIGILLSAIGLGAAIVGLLALCVGIIPAMIGVAGFASLVMVVAYLCMTSQPVTSKRTFIETGGPA